MDKYVPDGADPNTRRAFDRLWETVSRLEAEARARDAKIRALENKPPPEVEIPIDLRLRSLVVEHQRRPHCRVTHSTTQSITSGVATALTFDTDQNNQFSMHSTVTNPTRITIQQSGLYIVSASARFAANAGGNFRSLALRLDGVTTLAADVRANIGGPTAVDMLAVIGRFFTEGSYIEVVVQHDAGAAVNINANSASPFFWTAQTSD